MLVLVAALMSAQTNAACVKYKHYFEELDYCADPLYWSNYRISDRSYGDIDKFENNSKNDYEMALEKIWNNDEILVSRSKLIDCIGFAQRIACHSNFPRCNANGNHSLCKGMCQQFHTRCTVDNVDYIQRGYDSSYKFYTCDGLPNNNCSPASRGAVVSFAGVIGVALLSSVLLMYT